MALVVIDDSNVGIGIAPDNGFVIKLTEIEGFPEGLQILIPFEGERAQVICENINHVMGKGGPKVEIASPSDLARETSSGTS